MRYNERGFRITLSRKEKALIILEESTKAYDECNKQLKETMKAFMACNKALKCAETYLKRVLNEEENEGNIHKDCKYYDSKKDYCRNYMMSNYTGLAFEVSRHNKCIDDMKKDEDVE